METTVIYYTANTEDGGFEEKIRENILKHIGDVPLISVSQKPLPGFGKNICVGVHDNCYANEFRQVQIALNEVKTPYVLTAEADTLYPPEYFSFKPPKLVEHYRYTNVWVHYNLYDGWISERKKTGVGGTPKFYFKGNSNAAQAIGRDFWLNDINKALEGKKEWFTKEDKMPPIPIVPFDKRYFWKSDNPVVTFKTGKGVRRYTDVLNKDYKESLPYWGTAKDLRKEMFT